MTMESNQKFFPLFDSTGKLAEHFIGVANLESADPDEIRKGYERVIRPRFADAKFFFDEDRKTPLQAQRDLLRKVTYQQQLGSVFDKCERVAKLCATIAESLSIDAANVVRAAQLSKCDLMTRMVGEFPELQGVMGRYYAGTDADPETAEVANALDEFYAPRFAGDAIATSQTGRILAVAERLDTMAGIFSVGQKPSGNKDPFALRRAGLGLARTLIEGGLELELAALLQAAVQSAIESLEKNRTANNKLISDNSNLVKDLLEFIYDRLRNYYADRNIGADMFEAVLAVSPAKLTDFDQRIHAVVAFAQLPESQSLAAANKRIGNILKQAMVSAEQQIDLKQFESGAETELHKAIEVAAAQVTPMIAARRYVEALQILAKLRVPVDAFFENVMVMVDDPVKRDNRLAMLYRLRKLFLQVADISLMQPVG